MGPKGQVHPRGPGARSQDLVEPRCPLSPIGLKFGTLANLDPRIPKKWVPRVRYTPGVRGPGPRIPQDLVEPRCPLSPIGLKFGTLANSDPRIPKNGSQGSGPPQGSGGQVPGSPRTW